jgi:Fur family transcriptional regulator, ferric uptake regulator
MAPSHELVNNLRNRGYRLTPQRVMVVEQVEAAEGHLSAEEIFQRILPRYPDLNISTVYRTLDLLKGLGLVTETNMGDGCVRFHSLTKAHHHHLVCSACGKVINLDEDQLAPLTEALAARHGFQADLHHLAIFGRCRDCA